MCDDLGIGELGCYGQSLIKTPSIDKLASEGMLFTQHYSGSSVCAPTRNVLMTGMHTGHTYIRSNWASNNYDKPIPNETFTVAEMFKNAGYTTACIGKWGLGGPGTSGDPNYQGFDHFFGYLGQVQAHEYYPDHLWRNNTQVQLNNLTGENDYSHDFLTDEALWFIDQHKDSAFFLYIPYTIPHTKFQVPDLGEYASMEGWTIEQKTHAAMISRMDADVGRIIDSLKYYNIDENTLVIFTSDNGAHGLGGTINLFDGNGEYRGIKRDLYEGGIRAPHIAWWPGTIKPNTISDHISAFWDFLPTCCELLGEEIPENIDGISFLPTIWPDKPLQHEQEVHKFLYWEIHESGKRTQAIRLGDWKAVRLNVNINMDGPIELYNLINDVSETNDLASDYPDLTEKMNFLMLTSRTQHTYFNFQHPTDIQLSELLLSAGNSKAVVAPGDTLQLSVDLLPANAFNREIILTIQDVTPGINAEITEFGELIAGDSIGFIDVIITSGSNQDITSTLRVEITNELLVETLETIYLSSSSVKTQGKILVHGGEAIIERGFVYAYNENPTLDNIIVPADIEEKYFSSTILNLTPGQLYYIRAYAKTSSKIVYGEQRSIKTEAIDFLDLYSNLLFYYPFENSFYDGSENDNNPKSINGDPLFEQDGKFGTCLSFDAEDDYLITEQSLINPGTDMFTFCAWIKPSSDDQLRIIFQQESVDGNGRSILYLNNKKFGTYLSGQGYSSSNSYQLDEWTHVAITGDPQTNTIQFFVNGKAEPPITNVFIEESSGEINIGRLKIAQSEDRKWDGLMDEVMLFKTALTQLEVLEIMESHIHDEKSGNDIISFALNDVIHANISEEPATIHFILSEGMDITNVKTTIYPSKMATVYPVSGELMNFADNVIYTVTAHNGTKKEYTVSGSVSSIDNSLSENSVRLYPIPTTNYITLEFENYDLSSEIKVVIIKLTGEKVFENSYQMDSNVTIPFNLPPGSYVISLHNGSSIIAHQKLIINQRM